ncbi:FimB/Mfa2 family fimbrial subunit [Dysgonomonas sp. BGC7]|uniref:FimB/Mfa2 family fimbrial subunit n=1 Tax=Dysgonomonas sp. BGC7 TaxID=1658008 RepID=UPI000682AB50|nr:FimB/Mfa2 family fimbrial subunit [Dysgonomonas sp. BGC7]MBD8389104.1 FimB/Mfa2 family fimbrial subunit [Dysgonomonas sp. BGC7]
MICRKAKRRISIATKCQWIFLFILFLFSCIDEHSIAKQSDKNWLIKFTLESAGKGIPVTHSLSEPEENDVRQLSFLIFQPNGGNYIKTINSNSGNITTDENISNIKYVTVKLDQGNFDIVVIANAVTIIQSLALDGLSKYEVLSLLDITIPSGTKWATDGSMPFLMWGDIGNITVDDNLSSTGVSGIKLTRMTARVDVVLSSQAQSVFRLKTVRVYNYNTKGLIVPDITNSQKWDANLEQAIGASLPVNPLKANDPTPEACALVYSVMTAQDVACEAEIYLLESEAGSNIDFLNNTCLVVGGEYSDDGGIVWKNSFYRVDFSMVTDQEASYLPILRNHQYRVNITDVTGFGFPDPDEAFRALPANIRAEVIGWHNSGMEDVIDDGQYFLKVSQGEFSFEGKEYSELDIDNILSVTATNPSGWKIDKITDAQNIVINPLSGWLRTNITLGDGGVTTQVKILLSENSTDSQRNGYIYLSAGRLSYKIKVIQDVKRIVVSLDILDISGENEISELIFSSLSGVQPQPQQFLVRWKPVVSTVLVNSIPIGNNVFVYSGSSDQPGTNLTSLADPLGFRLLTIQPEAFSEAELSIDPFKVRESKVEFSIAVNDESITKHIFLRQLNYNLIADNSSVYILNGNTYTFRVRSNAQWKIRSISQEYTSGLSFSSYLNLKQTDNLRVGETGGNNTIAGDIISFTTISPTSEAAGKINIVFENIDAPKLFEDVTVRFDLISSFYPSTHKGWAGSNIYWDGSKLTFDDVGVYTKQNYQGVYFQWGSLYGISAADNFSSSSLVYKPDGNAVSGLNWSSIPRVPDGNITSAPPSGKNIRDRAYLYEITDGNAGIGDICKYLTEKGWAPSGKKWRMPTSNEFETTNSYSYSELGANSDANASGTNYIGEGYCKDDIGQPFFPRSGNRNPNDGSIVNVGSLGYYWSGTPSGTSAYDLYLSTGYLSPSENWNSRSSAYSVRCVVE